MEDIKEKLLCVLKNNIKGLETNPRFIGYFLKVGDDKIHIRFITYPKKIYTLSCRKNWWGLKKSKDVLYITDYKALQITYGQIQIELSREESEELLNFRKEKILENQLLELDKLCNTKI